MAWKHATACLRRVSWQQNNALLSAGSIFASSKDSGGGASGGVGPRTPADDDDAPAPSLERVGRKGIEAPHAAVVAPPPLPNTAGNTFQG